MSATIDDDAALYLWVDVTDLTSDPTTATIALEVGTTLYPMTWQGAAVAAGSTWSRTARTDARFIGTSRTPTGTDVQLPAGSYEAQPILTAADGQVIALIPTRLLVH